MKKIILVNTGRRGLPGESAYELWLSKGNVGTEEDFLNSIIEEVVERTSVKINAVGLLVNNNEEDLSALSTTIKTNLVEAINEVVEEIQTIGSSLSFIDDSLPSSSTKTWSIDKIKEYVASMII